MEYILGREKSLLQALRQEDLKASVAGAQGVSLIPVSSEIGIPPRTREMKSPVTVWWAWEQCKDRSMVMKDFFTHATRKAEVGSLDRLPLSGPHQTLLHPFSFVTNGNYINQLCRATGKAK